MKQFFSNILLILVTTFATPALAQNCVSGADIFTMDSLKEFSHTVTCVDGDLNINPLTDELIDISLPLLTRVSGGIAFGGGILRELRMQNLQSVGSNIFISMLSYPQPGLRFVSLPKLTDFRGEIIDLAGASALKPEMVELLDPAVRAKLRFE